MQTFNAYTIFNGKKINLNKYRARIFLEQPKKIPRKAPRKVLRRPRKDAQGFLEDIPPAQGCRARFYAGRARIFECPMLHFLRMSLTKSLF